MRILSLRLGVLLLGALTAPALAQIPGPPGAVCLCMKQSVDATNADMSAKNDALGAARAELDGIDQQLAAARAAVNVDNPQADRRDKKTEKKAARFHPLLETAPLVSCRHRTVCECTAKSAGDDLRLNTSV